MKLNFSIIFLSLVFLLLLVTLPYHRPPVTPPITPTPTVLAAVTEAGSPCHIRGFLPDPDCTPGVIDPAVTQDNLRETICTKGYTATIRPKLEYTNQLKVEQIKAYGYVDTNPKNYEEDHFISLELGGHPTDPKNLWPQPGASPNTKDRIENLCREKLCRGEITLVLAQKQIVTDWTTACQ